MGPWMSGIINIFPFIIISFFEISDSDTNIGKTIEEGARFYMYNYFFGCQRRVDKISKRDILAYPMIKCG